MRDIAVKEKSLRLCGRRCVCSDNYRRCIFFSVLSVRRPGKDSFMCKRSLYKDREDATGKKFCKKAFSLTEFAQAQSFSLFDSL